MIRARTRKAGTYKEFRNRLVGEDQEREKRIEIEKIKSKIAQIIYENRLKLNLTQDNLADELGVEQQVISRLEKGNQNITLESLINLLYALEIKFDVKVTKRKKREDIFHLV